MKKGAIFLMVFVLATSCFAQVGKFVGTWKGEEDDDKISFIFNSDGTCEQRYGNEINKGKFFISGQKLIIEKVKGFNYSVPFQRVLNYYFSPDGKILVISYDDRSPVLWLEKQ